jgi:hypothetical protein
MKKVKEILQCFLYGALPYWCYEKKRHYGCSWYEHLKINLNYGIWLIRNKR